MSMASKALNTIRSSDSLHYSSWQECEMADSHSCQHTMRDCIWVFSEFTQIPLCSIKPIARNPIGMKTVRYQPFGRWIAARSSLDVIRPNSLFGKYTYWLSLFLLIAARRSRFTSTWLSYTVRTVGINTVCSGSTI